MPIHLPPSWRAPTWCCLLALLLSSACGDPAPTEEPDVFSITIGDIQVGKPDIKQDVKQDIKQDADAKIIDTSKDVSDVTNDVPDSGDEPDEEDVSGNPCEANPCKEEHKTLCSNEDGVAVCGCDAGFDLKPDGSCALPCDKSLPPPKPAKMEPGDLVISEIMFDPVATDADNGEWFEIKNVTDAPIDANGLTLTDDANDNHVIYTCDPLIIQPGAVLTFAHSDNPSKNGGFKPDYVYGSDMALGLNDKIIVRAEYSDQDHPDIDVVKWGFTWPYKSFHGKAMSLDATETTAAANDVPTVWCPATEAMLAGDFGSPGKINPECPKPPDVDKDGVVDADDNCPTVANPDQGNTDPDPIGDSCDNCPQKDNADQEDEDKDGKGDVCDPAICSDAELDLKETCDDGNTLKNDGCEACQTTPMVPGKIVISELFVHSENQDDPNPEWIELYNPTASAVTINGWTIALKKANDGKGASHIIQGANVNVPALGYLVLGSTTTKASNGNVKVDYAYGNKLQMPNDADEVSLIDTVANTIVDRMAYGTNTPAMVTERSVQLDPMHLDSLANDKKTYWCLGSTPMLDPASQPTGGKGTPGVINSSCTPAGQDADGDTVLNENDNCVFTDNLDQFDADSDGYGDACDVCPNLVDKTQGDSDSDGVGNLCDNCLDLGNADQKDSNGNGFGDACDSLTCGNNKVEGPAETCDDSNQLSGDGCSMTCQKENFAPGVLVISEAMINPKLVDDEKGEWIEIYNPGDKAIDVNGWVLRDDATNTTTLKSDKALRVQPKSYLVLGDLADKAVNGGANVDFAYPYAQFQLNNASPDQIILEWNKTVIDKVAYQPKGYTCQTNPTPNCADLGFPVAVGKSMQIDPGANDATKNDDEKNWCEAKTTFGAGDYGSPNLANPPCVNPCEGKPDTWICGLDLICIAGQCTPAPKCGDGILQVAIGEECDDGSTKDGDGCSAACKKEVPPQPDGTLILTEVMPNPDAVPDQKGEWFEIYNPTTKAIVLTGWSIQSTTYKHVITPGGSFVTDPPVIEAKSFGVFIATADSTLNNGLKANYAWSDVAGGPLSLLNSTSGSATIKLINPDGKVIDEISYGPTPWSVGGSAMLKQECFSPAANDKPECWFPASLACPYGPQVGLTNWDWDLGTCLKDSDCTADPLQRCIPMKKSFVNAKFVYSYDKTGELKCAVRERGTPGVANICK